MTPDFLGNGNVGNIFQRRSKLREHHVKLGIKDQIPRKGLQNCLKIIKTIFCLKTKLW